MANNQLLNVIPTPFFEEKRGRYRIDYNKKTFRSDKFSASGKPLTDRQMKANVIEKVRAYDWSITGDFATKIKDALPDWFTYLGYKVEPLKGKQGQEWKKVIKIVDEPKIGRDGFEQYYNGMVKHISPILGDKQVGSVTREDIKAIIDKLLESRHYNSTTVKHVRKSARQFFEWQRVECKTIKENPVHDIIIKKLKLNRPRRSGEPEELDAIFNLMKYNHVLYACKCVLYTGMRPEEVCGMPEDYDYSSGVYYMNQVVDKYGEVKDVGKTENAQRGIVLSDFAIQCIADQREMKRIKGINSIYLFPNRFGKAMTPDVMSNQFRKFVRMINSDITLYELRHTALSIQADELSERDLKGMFGHSEAMETHETYDHQLKHRQTFIKDKINSAYKNYHSEPEDTSFEPDPFRV